MRVHARPMTRCRIRRLACFHYYTEESRNPMSDAVHLIGLLLPLNAFPERRIADM